VSPLSAATPGQIRLPAAAFAALLLAVAGLTLALWLGNIELRGEYEAKAGLLDRLKQNRAGAGRIAAPGPQSAAILAATETLAASELQKQVVERVTKAGGAVRSARAEVTREAVADGVQRLVARLSFDGSMAALQSLLFDLETGAPFIFVDTLAVQPSSPAMGVDETLQVTLVLSAYWTPHATDRDTP
jgi:hypothetical protein